MRIFPTALLITCLVIAAWLSPSLLAAIVVAIVGLHFGTQGNALVVFRNLKALGGGARRGTEILGGTRGVVLRRTASPRGYWPTVL